MAEVVLFHHVQGLTDGVRALADALRAGGHVVHTPDLYDGAIAASIEEGFAIRTAIGAEALEARTEYALAELPVGAVAAGISAGGMPAQRRAQTLPGAGGAILYETCVPITGEWAFGPWPAGVPVQIHGMDQDPFFALEGDLDAAREIVATVGAPTAELFVYPGDKHLFVDSSLPSYDAEATALVIERSLAFLDRVG